MKSPVLLPASHVHNIAFAAALACAGSAQAAALPPAIAAQLNANYPAVESLYLDLHRHPELAFQDAQPDLYLIKAVPC